MQRIEPPVDKVSQDRCATCGRPSRRLMLTGIDREGRPLGRCQRCTGSRRWPKPYRGFPRR